ncbi:MAG: glycosyltransferase, partial [Desulfobacterales bacterium]|nr:glycosyltransferase [Desulfobacterales bacterium]
MDNLTIDNALLRPQLADGWVLKSSKTPPFLKNTGANKGFEVNDISLMILDACDGIQSVESIIELLCAQFPGAKLEIPGDVEQVLRNLNEAGALVFVPEKSAKLFDIPEKTPLKTKKKLCIGMATYDDYDGVYFSLQAIRLYHPEVLDDIEFIVIDNHPEGPCAESLKRLENWASNYRYVPCDTIRGPWARYSITKEANADYILCIDSHVLIEPGVIKKLLDYFDQYPDTPDLLQGPLLNDDMRNISSHFVPSWSGGMYGTWSADTRAIDPAGPAFDIPMQGMGLFAFKKSSWPGVNPRFAGFGAEEGYVHEKFRQAGGRTLCLPFLRWLHRFNR